MPGCADLLPGTMQFCAKLSLMVLCAVAVRWTIAKHGYSGCNKPPMFGDFEAQRHWMEITVNLPTSQWYKNSTDNDLLYWGLDYPPLTAYHSFLCGLVAKWINPEWVALNDSRGLQNDQHKLFMRYSVVVADLLIYVPACVLCFLIRRPFSDNDKLKGIGVLLLQPGLALIDHGHFQYNGISLGLTLLAACALARRQDLVGAVLFCLALNYKQMELYHAMPFFCYLLGSCFKLSLPRGNLKLMMLAMVVVISFALCWLPFLNDVDTARSVLLRLFPFGRGLYEDKVANVWCSLSVVIKLKQLFTLDRIVLLCLVSTLVMLLPSSVHLLWKPSIQRFRLALVNASLVFFLFSFQVHEKSILIAVIPACLLVVDHPLVVTWFISISTFSMLPLLVKDGLLVPSVAASILCYEFIRVTLRPLLEQTWLIKALYTLSMCGAVVLAVMSQALAPPQKLPDLYTLLITTYSCGHFVAFLAYFHFLQFTA
ncbi:dolichyl pyrophosphate Man9GlcNAc2 alpha-1,3-glucosyltransferase-like [Babylonia areolata]|uniref:dolichyl pyrophosphate Man9GlcNAc2 alpha-1,3-glucosyltransferase-like n=1 Tax=Babylonia areolata TaxID=304850 RepID=UPI003FCF7982